MVMMFRPGVFLGRRAIQKIIFFIVLFTVIRAFWVHLFHFHALFGRKLWQMADEQNQLPTVVLRIVGAAESRHAGEAHAVFDDPEKFAIGKILRARLAEIGRLGIEAPAGHGIAAAVIRMAD